MGRYPDLQWLRDELAKRAEDFCRQYLPEGRREGKVWRIGNRFGKKGESAWIYLAGENRGRWKDGATGEGGDLFDLLRSVKGCRVIEAKDEAARFLGLESRKLGKASKEARTARFFGSAEEIGEDDPAGIYLSSRGLAAEDAGGLRWHPTAMVKVGDEALRMPAILAPVRTFDGELEAVHRIFITQTGGPAEFAGRRRNMGSLRAGGVWLGSRDAGRAVICEGVEDALAILRALDPEEKERLAVVASAGAGRIAAVEMPPHVRELVFVQDRDEAGERSWTALREKYEGGGVRVSRILPRGKDANEDLMELGRGGLREILAPLTAAADAEAPVAEPTFDERLDRLGAWAVGRVVAESLERGVLEIYAGAVIEAAFGEFGYGAVRALRDLGALSGGWAVLEACEDWLDEPEHRERFGDLPDERQVEEAVAEKYRRWRGGEGADESVAVVFGRISEILDAVGAFLRQRGHDSWDDVCRALAGPSVGAASEQHRRRRRRRSGNAPAPVAPFLRELSQGNEVPVVKVPAGEGAKPKAAWAHIVGAYRNADTRWEIRIGMRGIRYTIYKGRGRTVHGTVFPALPKLLRTAIHYASEPDERGRVPGFHYLMGAACVQGRVHRVRLVVKETKDGFVLHEHTPLGTVDPAIHGARPQNGNAQRNGPEPTAIPIGELLAGIKLRDGRFAQPPAVEQPAPEQLPAVQEPEPAAQEQQRMPTEVAAPVREVSERPAPDPATVQEPEEEERPVPVNEEAPEEAEPIIRTEAPEVSESAQTAERPALSEGQELLDRFMADWREHAVAAGRNGRHPFYAAGYGEMHLRMKSLNGRGDLPEHARLMLAGSLEEHEALAAGRKRVQGYLDAVESVHERRVAFRAQVRSGGAIAPDPEWREKMERLIAEGEEILGDPECALHLNELELGRERVGWAVADIAAFRRNDDRVFFPTPDVAAG